MRCAGDALALIFRKALRQFGIDKAGRDRVHGDAEFADLARQRPGKAGCGGLARAIDDKPL